MDEIMEDGNLVDRVRILLQRDMQYYQAQQTVLRESLCNRVSGGKLDFPRHASFAVVKIVKWWEAEFIIAFKYPSGLCVTAQQDSSDKADEQVVKKTKPSDFILLVVDTSEQLIEHLHALIQESLDHADLAVLTATLGAAALMRNCLWCYNQQSKDKIPKQISEKLHQCYKSYQEMAEAVAEKLLDLHCRLISLYILNEADSLNWQSNKPFFERERSSFIIQMWWLYMQGTKADLWNTVSPKMAQRIFAGMLNESLTIIVSRFIHGRPSLTRSQQFWSDAFNVLSCTAYLALAGSADANELIGLRMNKLSIVMRDIHAKCRELLICLLLRGTPLKSLYQVCRNGLEGMPMLKKQCGPAPWLIISAPKLFGFPVLKSVNLSLPEDQALILEINVLRCQPQAKWPQLLKVLSMNECLVARILLSTLIRQCVGKNQDINSMIRYTKSKENSNYCGGFLCTGCQQNLSNLPPTLYLYSLMYVLINTAMDPLDVVIPALKQDINWSNYLDRQQVWNQCRAPWLNALLSPFKTIMTPIVNTLLDAIRTGASIYQTMSLALACFSELFMCTPINVLRIINFINKNIPAHCHPIGGSVFIQIFCAALYSALLEISNTTGDMSDKSDIQETPPSIADSYSFDPQDKAASATALAEGVCSIDEDNKHTAQIEAIIKRFETWIKEEEEDSPRIKKLNNSSLWIETYADELLFTEIGRRSLKITYEYLICASDWILNNLVKNPDEMKNDFKNTTDAHVSAKPLTYVMFHIEHDPFDQWLTNLDESNWQVILNMPLSVTLDRIQSQILVRPEFKNIGELSCDDKDVAIALKNLCSASQSTSFE
ncbi:uncharacterized protein LOC103576648 [Microplitis demolitor]|uniref:uncharacterized protein LOC103576648 n=1 Tax=Microplitis demolitor TaxID=69319 RepID=UPI0004CDD786|nr:uncharacterized protein LOC103576648 [Microplitis demolitor]